MALDPHAGLVEPRQVLPSSAQVSGAQTRIAGSAGSLGRAQASFLRSEERLTKTYPFFLGQIQTVDTFGCHVSESRVAKVVKFMLISIQGFGTWDLPCPEVLLVSRICLVSRTYSTY